MRTLKLENMTVGIAKPHIRVIKQVLDEIERRTEAAIESGQPITGAHYRALLEVREELGIERKPQ